MLEEEFKKLVDKEWDKEEKELVTRIMDGLLYYKRFLPKTFKDDVLLAIQLCNKLKNDLEFIKTEENKDTNKENKVDYICGDENKTNESEIKDNEESKDLHIMIKELRNDIEELKTIILIDKKSKNSKKYKIYKKIIKIIFRKLSKEE